MTTINEAVYDSQRFNPAQEEATALNTGAANLMKVIDHGQSKIASALADWLDLAVQMDPDQYGRTVVERRLQYTSKNNANQAHIALYGNRTISDVQSGNKIVSKTVDFCATENLNYWENRWDQIKDQEDGMNGPSFEKSVTFVRLEEARLHWNYVKAVYDAAVELYETLMSVPFVYEPYPEKQVVETRQAPNNISLAQKLLKKAG